MNDVCINISKLRTRLGILRYKIGAKLFEPESKISDLCGEMILPKFGEYKYIHEIGSKSELILYLDRNFIVIFKKKLLY